VPQNDLDEFAGEIASNLKLGPEAIPWVRKVITETIREFRPQVKAPPVHRHCWDPIAVDSQPPNPHPRIETVRSTNVLFRCGFAPGGWEDAPDDHGCGDARSETLPGNWTIEQIRGETIASS
jgi:hypothetical protein